MPSSCAKDSDLTMRYTTILLLLLLSPGFLIASCGGRHTPDTVHTAKQSEREKRIEDLLQEYRKRIDELNMRTAQASESAHAELRTALEDLRKKHQEAAERLQKLRDATNTAWGDVNDELQGSLDRLKQALDRVRTGPEQQQAP